MLEMILTLKQNLLKKRRVYSKSPRIQTFTRFLHSRKGKEGKGRKKEGRKEGREGKEKKRKGKEGKDSNYHLDNRVLPCLFWIVMC